MSYFRKKYIYYIFGNDFLRDKSEILVCSQLSLCTLTHDVPHAESPLHTTEYSYLCEDIYWHKCIP